MGSGMNPKNVLYSAIIAGGAIAPAALVNGQIFENQCEGQLRVGCRGLPPVHHHIDQREPLQPLYEANAAYAVNTSTSPETQTRLMVSGPSGLVGFGDVLKGTNNDRGPFNLA
jgi:hypothetical protein